jgi:uncharacterized membrane protein YeaQ/YmgE (transglycosylase-associated protein family)
VISSCSPSQGAGTEELLQGGWEWAFFLWTILIGFVAGVLAKLITPGENEPSGFILTTILGIVGAFVATYLGQALGWYNAGEGAGFIGATVGAVIVLLIWGAVAGRQRSALP